jgi:phage terminase small subunit
MACEAKMHYLRFREIADQEGHVFIAEKSGYQCVSGSSKEMSNWWKKYVWILSTLGLSPSGRSGLKEVKYGAEESTTGRKSQDRASRLE